MERSSDDITERFGDRVAGWRFGFVVRKCFGQGIFKTLAGVGRSPEKMPVDDTADGVDVCFRTDRAECWVDLFGGGESQCPTEDG